MRITTYHASNSPVTLVTHKRFAPTVLLRKLTNNSTRTGNPASYKNWDLAISQRNGDASEKVTEKNLLSVLSNYFMIIPVRSFKSLEFMLELKRVDNSSLLFHVVHFVNCCWIFLELNREALYLSSGQEFFKKSKCWLSFFKISQGGVNRLSSTVWREKWC